MNKTSASLIKRSSYKFRVEQPLDSLVEKLTTDFISSTSMN